MSLLSQYESSKGLQGFTLGFYRFFEAFQYKEPGDIYNPSAYRYTWNDVLLSGGYTREQPTEYLVKPCSCIEVPSPLGGYGYSVFKCPHCGNLPVLGPPTKTLQQTNPYRNASFILELDEFKKEQERWITLAETQALYKKNKRELREECQRRINFFVQALHTHFAGQANCHTGRGLCDPYLRDIRNLAHLCLKD